ncbi:hypothetical protein KC332_g5224 [Hortaea werneckii]|uniref:Zn(2)-C6 fungal-type domain-containing protein n=1 Tax=Hortaea werneckii EXF-2000 TaxID=1157616 RepID=A0A1Z5TK95_HORWE|nr:hypothetical protein KC350_g18070 [Hortaea werneckii]OTA36427.1 hypothetical protein BTJ68_03879 [Hortaea werneckii EXF-2000]KAI6837192.1 hypothetical protein KC358_g5187 [Hortaea werneckii]KAI6938236.1 hypothetical protein KC341_g5026 [Hortaea werneckii]KAI6938592.1 hypothetical protein KC348_g5443 [Hortaea werneckii]
MLNPSETTPGNDTRKPKSLRRSRYGCRNCKLRKIKCDEVRPRCKQCFSFGVTCNYLLNIPDLQPVSADSRWQIKNPALCQLPPSLDTPVYTTDGSDTFHMTTRHQEYVFRYLGQAPPSISNDPNTKKLNLSLLELCFVSPSLMHASLALALAYDRYRNDFTTSQRRSEEYHHWTRSAALLKKRLNQPIETKDKDPIWGTAATLALLSFSFTDTNLPDRSWPVQVPSENSVDPLDWLRMDNAKMSLWHIVNPLRPESIFSIMKDTYAQLASPLPKSGAKGIPGPLASICGLGEHSTAGNNPYFSAAHAVSQLLEIEDSRVTVGHTQRFTKCIGGAFESLLRGRDPVALLLLYLWYSKAARSIWWIESRARVERPAIRLYLQRTCGADDKIQKCLLADLPACGGFFLALE